MKTIISGFGCLCSLGDNVNQITKNLYEQNVEPSFITDRFDSSYTSEYPAFEVSKDILRQKKADESYSFLFLRKALDEALKAAGLDEKELKKFRVGVCIGTSVDVSFNCFDFYKSWRKDNNVSLDPLKKYLAYSPAQEILNFLSLDGIAQTIVTACASGTDALGTAAEWIKNDLCDIAIAGAADELNLIPFTGFIKLMIASKKPCRPFDKNRNGINLGEGAGVFILESENARGGIKKAGTVLGYGTACDGYHITSPHPQGRGLTKALNFALPQAAISPDKISFINAHGTASIDNDAVEAKVFNSLLKGIPVNATKGLTGHALGAAGAIEACLSLIALNTAKVPKTKNFKTIDDNLDLVPTTQNINIDPTKAAVSTSLSFGGCNSVLILGGKNYE
ncbi:MAG: beta-ketoacyl-[acyl-carrier-protein] synthase family protein [Elusimicrobiota bacterium]|jgi:3-oxoacyl-[acyl-carrier-protein] synthase-1/3-oxoacyl-[acyl-carrier-protein] synthase II|nr:beta-ketoacyl-[acyl-carrier-protein] synthase family protein [Elusimicrobiota bacterium]